MAGSPPKAGTGLAPSPAASLLSCSTSLGFLEHSYLFYKGNSAPSRGKKTLPGQHSADFPSYAFHLLSLLKLEMKDSPLSCQQPFATPYSLVLPQKDHFQISEMRHTGIPDYTRVAGSYQPS